MSRKNILSGLFFVAFVFVIHTGFASPGNTFTDEYKISPKEVTTPGSAYLKCWDITYGEGRPVQVLLKETRHGEEYLIRTAYFEVKYVNGEKGFGVRPLKASERQIPEQLGNKVISAAGMSSQQVLCSQRLPREQVLNMIACFLPDLINENYRDILN